MTVTAASLRANYSEFASAVAYPNSDINYYITLAGLLLNVDRWSTLLDVGTELFVAHHITLETQNRQDAANKKAPGRKVGVLSSASVDKVSASYDVSNGVRPDAGHWNLTTYGTRFMQLVEMFGAGPVQVGIGYDPNPLSSAFAWPGPDTDPGLTTFGN